MSAAGAAVALGNVVGLPSGEAVATVGQGTCGMAEHPARRAEEIAALRLGLDLDMTLIDTAEFYADGEAERLVGEVIAGRRDEVFIVSKLLPQHATRRGTIASCERSLARMSTDRIDLYLLNGRGDTALEATLDAFEQLQESGKIRHWGVGNFTVTDLVDLESLPGGRAAAAVQVPYNLARRGIELDLQPMCWHRGLPLMGYSPLDRGMLLTHPRLMAVAQRHAATPAQVALAWLARHDGLTVIHRATRSAHLHQNRGALDLDLTGEDLAELDAAFPPPDRPTRLEIRRPGEIRRP